MLNKKTDAVNIYSVWSIPCERIPLDASVEFSSELESTKDKVRLRAGEAVRSRETVGVAKFISGWMQARKPDRRSSILFAKAAI